MTLSDLPVSQLSVHCMQGEEGLTQVLEILRDELKQAMILCGQ